MEKWPSGLRHRTANAASVMLRGFKSHLLRCGGSLVGSWHEVVALGTWVRFPPLTPIILAILLAGCAAEHSDAPICDFSRPTDILIAPLCLVYGIGQPMTPTPGGGGYSVASDDGNGFWGGVGSSHLGGGFTIESPEGTTFVNPPLFP
jgi:hypothetical protein